MEQHIHDKLEAFFQAYPTVTVPARQAMLVQRQDDPDIFWIVNGAVRMYHIRDDGSEITLHVFRAPTFFPLMVELSRLPNNYFFQTTETVTAKKAPASQVIAFLKQNPDVLFDLTSRFADAIMGLLKRIEQLSAPQAEERVARLLFYFAEKFGKPDGDTIVIDIHLTHDEIATWIGMARETVSHQIETLTKEGIITTKQHRITVCNFGRLRTLAG